MHHFYHWRIGDLITIGGLIISALTLLLGYRAYKRLLLGEARKKQLDLVHNIISKLQNVRVHFYFYDTVVATQYSKHPEFNFFELANMKPLPLNFRLFTHISWGLFVGLNEFANPLIPKKIHEDYKILTAGFHQKKRSEVPVESYPTEYYVLGLQFILTESSPLGWVEFEGGTNRFLLDCKMLNKNIIKWLKMHGISDIPIIT